MTRKDAERIIARIMTFELQLKRSAHARQQFAARAYDRQDLLAILRCHEIESAPEWSEEHQNFRVSVVGKCLAGGPTKIVLGLRQDGACLLVTIMTIRTDPQLRRTR